MGPTRPRGRPLKPANQRTEAYSVRLAPCEFDAACRVASRSGRKVHAVMRDAIRVYVDLIGPGHDADSNTRACPDRNATQGRERGDHR
jgi:hypothetical protein